MAEWKANVRPPDLAGGQAELFPLTLTGFLPEHARGAHIEFVADVAGSTYYCKRDKNGLPLRATEWFATSLASTIGIAVPDFAPIRNPENEEVVFGSKGTWNTAPEFEVKTFLMMPQIADKAILGNVAPWLGAYLSRLYALDLFLANPDRQLCNFLLVPQGSSKRLLAFDFASADLRELSGTNFPVAGTQTLFVGRQLRSLHPFELTSAYEALEMIRTVPESVVLGILSSMPDGWLSDEEKGKISGLWSDGTVEVRLAALRSGLGDGSLL